MPAQANLQSLPHDTMAAALCGLVLVFGPKLVSHDAAGLPSGMVSGPRGRLEPTLAGGLVVSGCGKCIYRVSAKFLELAADHPPPLDWSNLLHHRGRLRRLWIVYSAAEAVRLEGACGPRLHSLQQQHQA